MISERSSASFDFTYYDQHNCNNNSLDQVTKAEQELLPAYKREGQLREIWIPGTYLAQRALPALRKGKTSVVTGTSGSNRYASVRGEKFNGVSKAAGIGTSESHR